MTSIEALEIVISLAEQNVIGSSMIEEQERQLEAIRIAKELIDHGFGSN